MAQTIIGIDIGTHAVKVVRCRRTVGGIRWLGSSRHELTRTEARAQAVPAALRAVLTNGGIPASWRASRVIVGMPTHLLSTRVLTVPFLSAQQVRQVLPFEMESHLPLALDDVVVESQLIHVREASSLVIAAALPKVSLRERIELCGTAGVDPAVVDAEAFALHAYARYALGELEDGLAVIDIGAAKTTVCVVRDRQPRFARAILAAGDAVTAGVQEALSVPHEEAEQWKRSRHVREEPVARALEPLIAELRRSLHAFESVEGIPVSALMFTGGGSALDGLPAYVAERLGKRLAAGPPADRSWLGDSALATAVGLAVKGVWDRPLQAVNFRRGEFAVPGEETPRSGWLTTAAATGLLLLLGVTDLWLHDRALERRQRALKAEVRSLFQSAVPEARVVVDEVQQFKTAMQEMRRKAAMFGLGRAQGQRSSQGLNFLIGLSERVPPDLAIEIQDLVMERDKVSLEAETDSFNSIDRIKAVVERLEGAGEVKVSEARVAVDQTRVKFRLTLSLKETP